MSRGPKNVTSTTETEPPAFLLGPLTTAANAAQSRFLGSQPSGSGFSGTGFPTGGFGSLGAGGGGGSFGGGLAQVFRTGETLNPRQQATLDQSQRIAREGFGGGGTNGPAQPFNPNDLIGQSQDLTSRTLAGDFLDPNSNPFLQGTFDRAADLTRTRLSSEFAGAGRNLGAAQPARSDELQTLASNIFGGNFQRERDRQVGAVDQSQGLDPLNMFINQLAGIIPGAGGSTQSTQPVFRTGLF